mgnify:FL=1
MDKLENKRIAVIGGGHIGLAFIEGLMNSGRIDASKLIVANPSLNKILYLRKFGISITTNNREAANKSDLIFIAVKPTTIFNALHEIKDLTNNKLLISFVAAVRIKNIRKILGNSSAKIIRAMPNIPICINEGVIGFYSEDLKKNEKQQLFKLFSLLGHVVEVTKELDIDRLTVVSGCGPALVSHYINMLGDFGAQESTIMHIIKGTISYLSKKNVTPLSLINSVATKGGITESILKSLDDSQFKSIFYHSLESGLQKIKILSCKKMRTPV